MLTTTDMQRLIRYKRAYVMQTRLFTRTEASHLSFLAWFWASRPNG